MHPYYIRTAKNFLGDDYKNSYLNPDIISTVVAGLFRVTRQKQGECMYITSEYTNNRLHGTVEYRLEDEYYISQIIIYRYGKIRIHANYDIINGKIDTLDIYRSDRTLREQRIYKNRYTEKNIIIKYDANGYNILSTTIVDNHDDLQVEYNIKNRS